MWSPWSIRNFLDSRFIALASLFFFIINHRVHFAQRLPWGLRFRVRQTRVWELIMTLVICVSVRSFFYLFYRLLIWKMRIIIVCKGYYKN
jgi:hypothetical protein